MAQGEPEQLELEAVVVEPPVRKRKTAAKDNGRQFWSTVATEASLDAA